MDHLDVSALITIDALPSEDVHQSAEKGGQAVAFKAAECRLQLLRRT